MPEAQQFGTEAFIGLLALVGIVILVAALLSGFIERSGLPQVAVFLALGAALGVHGLGLVNITLESPALRVVATISLALVLFTDALTLDLNDMRKHKTLALLVLGPGTLLTAALVTVAGWWMLGLPLAGAAVVGAALASTDPVLLRGLLRRRDVAGVARQALRLESGLNDVVLLPVVLVAMVFLGHSTSGAEGNPDWASLALNLFLLGPGAGIAVGLLAVATLDLVRRRIGVRRDYESLYSLGVAFAAFAAAEALHASGFLAAFAAGLTIAALDVELCDCFLEYGETTAEMALLFTFVLFGSSLIWTGLDVLSLTTLAFALLVLLIRPVVVLISLARMKLVPRDRFIISWFGPRGLSTLLLVLLPVFEGIPGSDQLFAICALVVLLSVVVHGGSLMMLNRNLWKGRSREGARHARAVEAAPPAVVSEDGPPREAAPPPERSLPVALTPLPPPSESVRGNGTAVEETRELRFDAEAAHGDADFITVDELRRLQQAGEPVVVLDVRSVRTYEGSDLNAGGAIRINPEYAVTEAKEKGLPRDALLVAFCA